MDADLDRLDELWQRHAEIYARHDGVGLADAWDAWSDETYRAFPALAQRIRELEWKKDELARIEALMLERAIWVARRQLVAKFPRLADDEFVRSLRKRMDVLASTEAYQDGPWQERFERLMSDACRLAGEQPQHTDPRDARIRELEGAMLLARQAFGSACTDLAESKKRVSELEAEVERLKTAIECMDVEQGEWEDDNPRAVP